MRKRPSNTESSAKGAQTSLEYPERRKGVRVRGETGKETERVPFLSIISVFPHFPKFIPFRLSPSGYSSLSNAWVVKLLPARKECGSQFPRTEGTLIHLEPSQKCLKFLILCLPLPQYQKQGSVRGSQFLPPNSSQYWSHRESTPSSD